MQIHLLYVGLNMALLQTLWMLLAIALYFLFSTNAEKVFVPSENETCPAQPCRTLSEYAREANRYFLDNTIFTFSSGVHQLDIHLHLENVSNVSFTVLNEAQDHTVQILLSPLVNITWSDCDNIVINGLVFVLSGDPASGLFSAVVFQRTTSFLRRLVLFGNGILQSTAIRANSSQVKISDVMVWGATSLYGAALFAFNSTVEFFGQNVFINNTATQGGAMVFIESISNFYGNSSFISNNAVSQTSLSLGGAIFCENSIISFEGTTIFQLNQATALILANFSTGGAIVALTGSMLTFKATSNLTFTDNTATGMGGAMSVSTSEVAILGSALFEGNIAGLGGGAIRGDSNSRIYCSGKNIRFQGNHVRALLGLGGAILTQSSDVELEEILFEENVASAGGAIGYFDGSYLHISTCEFVNNSAFTFAGAVYIDTGTTVIFDGINRFERNYAYVSSGAVSVTLTNVNISGENTFCKNGAMLGSGSLELTLSNSTICGMSRFYSNYGASGGGIRGILSNLTISGNSSFIDNTANNQGGGLMFTNGTLGIHGQASFVKNGAVGDGSAIFVSFSNVTVGGNTSISDGFISQLAILKGAIGLYNSRAIFTGFLTLTNNSAGEGGGFGIKASEVDFEGCVQYLNNQAVYSGGGIYAINSNISLRDSRNCSKFQSNIAAREGGAIYAVSSSVYMTTVQNFIQNSAQQGGALALSGGSKLILTKPFQANFVENQALTNGGAMLFEDTSFSQCTESSNPGECFIELSSTSNIQLNFVHNTAGSAGTVLYGGRLDSCRLYIGGGIRSNCGNIIGGKYSDDPIDTFQKISKILSNDNATSEISSDPLQVCVCTGSSLECTDQVIDTVRGKEFSLLAVTVGQNKGIVPSFVRTSLTNDVQISASQRIQRTRKQCIQITYRLSTDKNTTTLILFPDGPCRDTINSRRKINVNFLPCPDGFTLHGSECVCEDRLQQYTTNCSIDDSSIVRSSNTFWMGTFYNNGTFEGLILHSGCPFDYCVDSPVSVKLDDLSIQCDHNHSGTLCGSCKIGYSIAFGTLHCLPCNNYYVALVVPFALAGIVLVAFLLLLQLSVATGTVNGLIFYANVIQVNRFIFLPPGEANIITIFIAWLNLDLGIETCFYDGLNAYAFTWLQFLFPFYIWFLIGLIIVMSHFSKNVAKSLGKNPVATLATLFLLSYSKILRTVIVALSFTRLEYPDGANKLVWLYDGNVPYFQRSDHIVLGTFAIITLLFLFLPYTFLLLCGHWLQAYSHWWILSWLNKIKPFMDAYHAPYKKDCRYWTGIFLLARCALFLTFAFNVLGNASVNLLAILSVTAGLAVLAWIHNRVYEKLYNNILEASFVLNLCIFAAATYHVRETRGSQAGLVYTSIGIAFATFICIVIYHFYLNVRKTTVGKKLLKIKYYILQNVNQNRENNAHKAELSEDKQDSEIVQAPTTTTVELREPLLEK